MTSLQMPSLREQGRSIRFGLLAAGLGWVTLVLTGRASAGDGDVPSCPVKVEDNSQASWSLFGTKPTSYGRLSYGGPASVAGFQGFGLGYHLGYGYGGDALGTGAEGGYPFYGGPGYPRCDPVLRRIGRITPFPYFGGPGYSAATHTNYFNGISSLVADQPVITIGDDHYDTGYGTYTGAIPYPEAVLAPFTTRAAAAGSSRERSSDASTSPAGANAGTDLRATPAAAGGKLGVDSQSAVDAAGVRGLLLAKVYPGSMAEKAGLRAGDVIHSINGYLTSRPSDLAWVLTNAAPESNLKMNVRSLDNAKDYAITISLRLADRP